MRSSEEPNALAVAGSLRRGAVNHWLVSRLPGEWCGGFVRGWTFEITWGPAEGDDGFVPDAEGARVEVDVIAGDRVVSQLGRVDDELGPGYERRVIEVELSDGVTRSAWIHVALTEV